VRSSQKLKYGRRIFFSALLSVLFRVIKIPKCNFEVARGMWFASAPVKLMFADGSLDSCFIHTTWSNMTGNGNGLMYLEKWGTSECYFQWGRQYVKKLWEFLGVWESSQMAELMKWYLIWQSRKSEMSLREAESQNWETLRGLIPTQTPDISRTYLRFNINSVDRILKNPFGENWLC